MPKNICQTVLFRNTTPRALYELYMNAKKHSKVTGAPAKISAKTGTRFSAHGNYITGENLLLIKNELIVQTWRGADWDAADSDSTFLIQLEKKGKNVVLRAVHSVVPDKHAGGIEKGWFDHYWKPWKNYLAAHAKKSRKK
jgi:activator of HSP90 ATPase